MEIDSTSLLKTILFQTSIFIPCNRNPILILHLAAKLDISLTQTTKTIIKLMKMKKLIIMELMIVHNYKLEHF